MLVDKSGLSQFFPSRESREGFREKCYEEKIDSKGAQLAYRKVTVVVGEFSSKSLTKIYIFPSPRPLLPYNFQFNF